MLSRVVLVLPCLLLAGCPEDEKGLLLQFPRILEPTPNCATATSIDFLPLKEYAVRLSFLRRPEGLVNAATIAAYELVCDHVFPRSTAGTVEIAVPSSLGTRFTVRAEAFLEPQKESFVLEYTGLAEDLDLTRPDAKLFLRPVAGGSHPGFSCIAGAVEEPRIRRAFHSATALPNGGVLIAGGLVVGGGANAKIDESTGQRVAVDATNLIEVYEPRSQTFLSFPGGMELARRRAFHQAFLLPSPAAGPYKILFLGGVTPRGASAAAVWLRQASENLRPFVFSPHDEADPAPAELVTYTPGEAGQPGTVSTQLLADLPRAYFPNASLTADGLGIIGAGGGAQYRPAYAGSVTSPQQDRGFPTPDVRPFFINLKAPEKPEYRADVLPSHVGAALAQLSGEAFLLLGGSMTGAETGQRIPSPGVAGPIVPYDLKRHLAWQTLTPIGPANTALLRAGGYRLTDDTPGQRFTAVTPEATAPLEWIGADLSLRAVGNTASFTPVGYHTATRLPDGAVLLAGGSGGSCGAVNLCPSGQVVVYEWDGGNPGSPRPRAHPFKCSDSDPRAKLDADYCKRLSTPRLGHQATLLTSGAVLVTGGLTLVEDKTPTGVKFMAPYLVRMPEVYNPRTGLADDDPWRRPPGKVKGDKTCKLRAEIPKP